MPRLADPFAASGEWYRGNLHVHTTNSDGSMPSPNEVYEVFKSEFDVAYDEGGLYILTMHPHFMGHRSRAAMLDRLIAYMKSKPGVWFATHEQIARHVRQAAEDGGLK